MPNNRNIIDKVFDKIPNFYGQVSAEISQAIKEEIKSYNFTKDKEAYIVAKIEGSIAGASIFDDQFQNELATATTPAGRRQVIRKYLRNYISKEITIEIGNIQREVRSSVIKKKGSLLAALDPRWSKPGKPGDFSQNEEYRKNIASLLFPQASIVSGGNATSEYSKFISSITEDFNKDPDNYFVKNPPKNLSVTQMNLRYSKNPKDRELLLNLAISQKLKSVYSSQVFSPELGEYITLEQQIILSRINKDLGKSIDKKITPAQKLELIKAIQTGDLPKAEKYFLKNKGFDSQKYFDGIKQSKPEVAVDKNGKATIKGTDSLKEVFDSALTIYKDKVTKNSSSAIYDLQHGYAVSTIATLKSISGISRVSDPQLQITLGKTQVIQDILELGSALKGSTTLSQNGIVQLGVVKNRLLSAISSGSITFGSESEKNNFIKAVNEGNHSFIKRFSTPGVLGSGAFAKLLKEVNDSTLELGTKYDSQELVTRSLDFNNNLNLYKKEILDRLIYAGQLASDSGYFVSEIKKKLKQTQVGQIISKLDTPITFESIKKKSLDTFVNIATNNKLLGRFAANKDDLNTLIKYYSGQMTFKDLALRYAKVRLENLLKKLGLEAKYNFKFTLDNILKSQIAQKLKFYLAKNFKFLQQGAGVLFKKLSGPLSSVLSKGISLAWSRFGGFAGKFISSSGGFIASLLARFGIGSGDALKKIIVAVFISIGSILLFYFLFSLVPMMVILGGFNSLSVGGVSSSSDINYGGSRSLVGQNNLTGGAFASGNACISPSGQTSFPPKTSDWDNLTLRDFDGTVNEYNCQIMCNAKRAMGALFPGPAGYVNCNANSSYKGPDGEPNKYWCTNLVIDSYAQDDPGLVQGSVIQMDRYLNQKAASGLYIATQLTDNKTPTIGNPYIDPNCVSLDDLSPGSILITKPNTCNDNYYNYTRGNSTYTVFDTLDASGQNLIKNFGAHVEIILKIEGEDTKVLQALSSNHIRKKITYQLQKCSETDSKGNPKYKVMPKNAGIPLRDAATGSYGSLVLQMACKVYTIAQKPASCPTSCNVGPNNYPDAENYGGGSSGIVTPPATPYTDTNVQKIMQELGITMSDIANPQFIYNKLYTGNYTELDTYQGILPIFASGVTAWSELVNTKNSEYNSRWNTTRQINPNYSLTIMSIESQGVPTAVSRTGATGLMQILLSTANNFFKYINDGQEFTRGTLSDPAKNIAISVALLGDAKYDGISNGLTGYKLIDYMSLRYNQGSAMATPFFGIKGVPQDPSVINEEGANYRISVARSAILAKIAVKLKEEYDYTDEQIRTALRVN